MIKKKDIFNLFTLFLIVHLIIWTIIPSVSNINLPLDTIEALAWGSNLDWGFNKHPPVSAFAVEIFYFIFGNSDWAYYLLSQIFIIIGFIFVWKLSNSFFKNKFFALISVLLLEGIYFYNFTSPEFNVNVCQIPFWAMSVFYCWESIQYNRIRDWVLFGIFAGLGFLSKYLFIYLILSISIFFLIEIAKKKKFNYKYFIPILIFSIILSPHLFWLLENNFSTVTYGIDRTGLENKDILNHFYNPIIFVLKQVSIILPLTVMFLVLLKKFKLKINLSEKKTIFLLSINILPLLFMLMTSILTGGKIRTMWMTPFYLFFGVLLINLFYKQINIKNFSKFFAIFAFLFILSPSLYYYISISNENKRTDYPGNEIAYLVQKKWDANFNNEIKIVVGDEWFGGNLSYHLNTRPKWYNTLNNDLKKIKPSDGVVYMGNPNVLKKVCPGVFGTIKPIGICMIGIK